MTEARYGAGGCSNSIRGLFGGGVHLPSAVYYNTIDYITIATLGNAIDFGDLFTGRYGASSCSSSTRGVWFGGKGPSPAPNTTTNTIEYVQIMSTGDAIDFGDISSSVRFSSAACSNGHGGL